MSSQPQTENPSHDAPSGARGLRPDASPDASTDASTNASTEQDPAHRWHRIQPAIDQLDRIASPMRQAVEERVARASVVVNWVNRFRIYRVVLRFTSRDGNLLSAGMSYRAIFAVFAALWLGFSVAGAWLVGNAAIHDAVVEVIDRVVPGLIGTDGVISDAQLQSLGGSFGWTGAIAAVGLLWTATSWLNAVRLSVRVMFDLGAVKVNLVLARLGDVALALGFGVVLIVAALLSVATTTVVTTMLSWVGIHSTSVWATTLGSLAGFLIVAALNVLTLAVMFRVLSRVSIPMRSLLAGAALGGVSLSVLSTGAGYLFNGAGRNPLLASFAVFFGLLLWFNLVCRVILLAASWIAVGMSERGITPRTLTAEQREWERERAEYQMRVTEAEAAVAQALREYEDSRGLGKILSGRRLTKAHSRLGAIVADRADPAGDARRLGQGGNGGDVTGAP